MVRCEKVRLEPGKRQQAEYRLLGDRVSRLWNAANYKCRQAFLAKTGVPSGPNLEKLMKAEPEYRQLPSDIAQEVLKKLSEAWKSYWALRDSWGKDPVKNQKPGLPKYRKDRKTGERPFDLIPVKHPRSYTVDSKDVAVVLPRDRRRTAGAANGRLHVTYRGRRRHQGKTGRAEMTWDAVRRRWYFAWSVTVTDVKPKENGRHAAVDLGVRILASLSIEGVSQAMHFEGREAMKDWDWFGREIAREQNHIAGTRGPQPENRSPSSRNISLLHRKRAGRLAHVQWTMANAIALHCRDNGVTTVHIGHPKNILRDVTYGSSKWAGRIHNFWSFDRTSQVLACALAGLGIGSRRVGERGSSSHCPSCGSDQVVRHPRWKLRCKECGDVIHSDQAGSRNILQAQKPSVCWAGAEAAPSTETARWDQHRWAHRSTNPKRAAQRVPEFLEAA